jgi:hypothetical protein
MAVRFRDTRARFRERARFLGLETNPLPIVGAALAGALMLTFSFSANPGMDSVPRTLLCCSPLILTIGYIWGLKTGRRPSFDRDLLMYFLNGKSVAPLSPGLQPLHPGIRQKTKKIGLRSRLLNARLKKQLLNS